MIKTVYCVQILYILLLNIYSRIRCRLFPQLPAVKMWRNSLNGRYKKCTCIHVASPCVRPVMSLRLLHSLCLVASGEFHGCGFTNKELQFSHDYGLCFVGPRTWVCAIGEPHHIMCNHKLGCIARHVTGYKRHHQWFSLHLHWSW